MGCSSRTLSRWYLQLAASLEAGLGLERAVGAAKGPPAHLCRQLQARLAARDGVDEALEAGGTWLPEIDRQLLVAGAQAGRLPEIARRLAARHEDAARLGWAALAAALYPALVAHVGMVVVPLPEIFSGGGVEAYFEKVAVVLLPAWLLIGLVAWGIKQRWSVVAWMLDRLPLIGGSRRFRALADLALILEIQLVAGIRIDMAWLRAALASGDRRLELVAVAASEAVQRGEPVGPVLAGRPELPSPFSDFYLNGEQTGRLDESLHHLQAEFQRRARARLGAAAVAYPMVLFAAVVAGVAYQVLSFWLEHFRQLEAIG